jgi:hypothetical protein
MCIFVSMWNVPKVHVSVVKTQWKHMKTLAKLCIPCIIYGTCVFLYPYKNVPKVHVSAVKTVKILEKLCISCIIYGTFVFVYTC